MLKLTALYGVGKAGQTKNKMFATYLKKSYYYDNVYKSNEYMIFIMI